MIRRDLTAMARRDLSRPVQIAIEHEIVSDRETWLDYGCGRGFDVDSLSKLGWKIRGWDPVHRKSAKKVASKIVSLIYVLNVIEKEDERRQVLLDAWKLSKKCLVVAARLDHERDGAHVRPFADGWLTSKGTFQRFFDHTELQNWLEFHLRQEAVVAAPGVFYIFKSDNYGGFAVGPRWLMWVAPLFLLTAVPVIEGMAKSKTGRLIALVLLIFAVLAANYPGWNAWRHPWIYDAMLDSGWPGY